MRQILYCYFDEYNYLLILKDFKYILYDIDNFDIIYKQENVEIYNREKLVTTLSYFEASKSYCFINFKDFSYDYFLISEFLQELKNLKIAIVSKKEHIDMLEERGINSETAGYFIHDKDYKINYFKENSTFYAFMSKYTYSYIDNDNFDYYETTCDSYLSKSYFSKKEDYIKTIEYIKLLNEYINNIPLYFIQFKSMFNE